MHESCFMSATIYPFTAVLAEPSRWFLSDPSPKYQWPQAPVLAIVRWSISALSCGEPMQARKNRWRSEAGGAFPSRPARDRYVARSADGTDLH